MRDLESCLEQLRHLKLAKVAQVGAALVVLEVLAVLVVRVVLAVLVVWEALAVRVVQVVLEAALVGSLEVQTVKKNLTHHHLSLRRQRRFLVCRPAMSTFTVSL